MNKDNNSIKYSHLAFIFIAFLSGIVIALLSLNILEKEIIEFSTLGLIGFALSIIFGSSSIVLAISAIHLGRLSEEAIIKRSDESIEIQNKVSQKTIEVLGRIESSTGVTEKRIEDIIAGRVSHAADNISSKKIHDRKNIEKELRKTFAKKLTPEEKDKMEKTMKEREDAGKRYDKIHESILLALSNESKIKTIKLSEHGSFIKDGIKLFDGVFDVNNSKIGISIFSDETILEDIFILDSNNFLTKVTQEIEKGTVKHFFYLSNKDSSTSEKLKEELKNATKILKSDLQNKIHIETGDNSTLINRILDITKE